MSDGDLGISLIADLLNSGYPEDYRYRTASEVVQRLGKWFDSARLPIVRRSWIPALFDFLSLCEKFYTTESPPHPGFIALRILSAGPRYDVFSDSAIPVLTSTLLPTHPLRSRRLALKVFDLFAGRWLFMQMGDFRSEDLCGLLQAVGDLFQFLDPPLQDGEPAVMVGYDPLMAVLLLIEFASSDVWHNHLRRSNFTSCEEIMSTREGKKAALERMFEVTTGSRSALLRTPQNMIAAIERLEEIQCFNTAEVMILWAWTTGVVNPVDREGWRLIGNMTLWFYRAQRRGRLTSLSQHITDTTMVATHLKFLVRRYGPNPCRVRPPPLPVPPPVGHILCISRACQLGRLYYLFGYDPATWRETAAAEEVEVEVGVEAGGGVEIGRGVDVSSGSPVIPGQFTEWVCDYP